MSEPAAELGQDTLASALSAIERGWFVHPLDHPEYPTCIGLETPQHDPATCVDRGKHPCTPFSKRATDVAAVVRGDFGRGPRNIGVAAGPSRLLVVDEDTPGGLIRYATRIGAYIPDTYRVTTGRGQHYYFEAPDAHHGNGAGILKAEAGCDVRGAGGYVVGAGSLHVSGVLYEAVDPLAPVAPIPDWILEAINTRARAGAPTGTGYVSIPRPAGSHGGLMQWLAESLPPVILGPRDGASGHRHAAVIRVAGSLRKEDCPLTEAEAFVAETIYPRLEQVGRHVPVEEILAVIRDIYRRYAPSPSPMPEYAKVTVLPTAASIGGWPMGKAEPPGAEEASGGDSGESLAEQGIEQGPSDAEKVFEWSVEEEARKLRIRAEAQRRVAADARPKAPGFVGLANFLAQEFPEQEWAIDQLLPREGIVLFSAPQKAGKSTTIGNLVRALVDGDRFLNSFTVQEPLRVALIDTELGDRRLWKWLGDQNIQHLDRAQIMSLRGNEAAFDPRDPQCRAEWVPMLEGIDVLLLDVVGPVLAALGLDENSNADVGAFWTAFRTLLIEAGVPCAVMVHHTGHNETRAIGASSWLRYPDAIWKIEREDEEPTSGRFFSAYGRDVEVYAGALTFEPLTRRLSYTGQGKGAAKASRHVPALVGLLTEHGPKNQAGCIDLLRAELDLSRDQARPVPAQGVRDRLLIKWSKGKSEMYGVNGIHVPGAA